MVRQTINKRFNSGVVIGLKQAKVQASALTDVVILTKFKGGISITEVFQLAGIAERGCLRSINIPYLAFQIRESAPVKQQET